MASPDTSASHSGEPTAETGGPGTVHPMPARSRRVHPDYDKLPQRLSISRGKDYMKCPKLFYFKTILGIHTPGSIETTRGTLAHEAFERIFDHPAGERTPEVAISYIRPAWDKLINPQLDPDKFPEGSPERQKELDQAAEYRELAPPGSQAEADLLATAEQVVRSWFAMERVNNFTPTDLLLPDGSRVDGREIHVAAKILGVPLHGFIDRLDRWESPAGRAHWSISDYKSGKVPGEGKNYRYETMLRIVDEAFLQLRVYAVLVREVFGITVDELRLVYVATGDRERGIKKVKVTEEMLDRTATHMQSLWNDIEKSARTGEWQTKTSKLCEWCYFKDVCPAVGGAELGELLPEEINRRMELRRAA